MSLFGHPEIVRIKMLELDDRIVSLKTFGGDWVAFNEAIYQYFCEDFIEDCPIYKQKEVWLSDHNKEDGKEGTFWHITTNKQNQSPKGSSTEVRIPDIKRSERIRWIKDIIENSNDPNVKRWVENINGRTRHHLLYKEEFLVVLGEIGKNRNYVLITSYYINENNRKKYLQRFETYR